MSDQRIVWVDLETGGLDPLKHQIIQIAAIVTTLAGLEELESFEAKIQLIPEMYTDEALELNSYDATEWASSARPADDVRADFTNLLERHMTLERVAKSGRPYRVAELGGHNLAFDVEFLRAWYGRQTWLPASAWTGGYFDTMHIARTVTLFTGQRWKTHKLGDLCAELGISAPDHDALGDVRATVSLARELVKIIRRK